MSDKIESLSNTTSGMFTPHQARYFAEQIMLRRPKSSMEALASAMSGVKVDLNPHQVDAALFAVKSPLSNGVILADEVGLGKTIEAGIVLAQYWAERKRKILLITPASLRMQWKQELEEKFFIESLLIESKFYNQQKTIGVLNPFEQKDKVIICSYDFAANKKADVKLVNWDLVIMDEAHKLRNVYKSDNVKGKKLKDALHGREKLLLTATPLQNNLMELYGLVSIIDDQVFGDARTFREMYISVKNEDQRNRNLRARLNPFCKRTLRSQVTEYVKYTKRLAILREYVPSREEELLYEYVSSYLQREKLYALPQGQRTLITLVLRKLLASSSFAISGTLESLIKRLEDIQHGESKDLEIEDYDTFEQLKEEGGEECNATPTVNESGVPEELLNELEDLKKYADLARSITKNTKGEDLLKALKEGFSKTQELGGLRKAVIFTESKRTQDYLFRLLSDNGYEGEIVFLNGNNNDETSRKILREWKERHKNDGKVTNSPTANIKAAVVEEFQERASILIGTEAAAEGINLQFCSLLVNYDLPWNPQRIEQRIGRCHRYGQKNDVVVINFLNKKNAADVRVYQLLDQKFRLFNGVFGSSDEVLGSLESGVDFEKRVAEIYQKCKKQDEIQREFDLLQEEMSGKLEKKMSIARQSILENFDEAVASRLKSCQENARGGMTRYSRWLYFFSIINGARPLEDDDGFRLNVPDEEGEKVYNLDWKSAEQNGEGFLRKEEPVVSAWLDKTCAKSVEPAMLEFKYSGQGRTISFLKNNLGKLGFLSVDKMIYTGIEAKEYLILTAEFEDGVEIDKDTLDSLLELPAKINGELPTINKHFNEAIEKNLAAQNEYVEEENKRFYLTECDKLDAYSEDLKEGLKHDLLELKKKITEQKKELKSLRFNSTLDKIVEAKEQINKLVQRKRKMESEISAKEDEIDEKNEKLQEEIRERLKNQYTIANIMTIGFTVI